MSDDNQRAAAPWTAQPETELDDLVTSLSDKSAEPRLEPGEQRQVGLLFIELQDLASWEEVLKGGELGRVLDKVYAIFSGVVASFGGYVERTEGSLVLALFGNRSASEQDAERAVRAALDMFDKLHNINRYLGQRGIHLEITASAHVGEVSVDAQGRLQGGDAIQVALDLNRSASVNTLLVSRATRDLLGDVMLFESLGAIHLGGQERSQPAFRVLGFNPRGEGRWQRTSMVRRARFVGRDRVLAALMDSWKHASDPELWRWEADPYRPSKRWVPTVFLGLRGEAGAGKSRTMRELVERLTVQGVEPMTLRGRADLLANAPYGLFVSLVKHFAGVQDEDAPPVRRRKLEAATRPVFLEDPVLKAYLPVLGWLVGVPYPDAPLPEGDPRAVQEEIHIAVTELLRTLAAYAYKQTGRPLLVLLKDLHAADARSLSTLLTVMERLRLQLPVMIVGTYRATYRLPRELALTCRFTELTLGPLSHNQVQQVVASMLDGFRLPSDMVRQVQRMASGNPYFVEELVRNMVDTGALVKSEKGWALSTPDAAVGLPQSLSGLLLARFDTLPREVRDTLVCASAIGVFFSREVLAEVVRRLGRPAPDAHLKLLEEGRFLRRVPAAREEAFSFPNLLSREVVYGTLLPANRTLLHKLVGEALVTLYTDTPTEHFSNLGHHFAEGGEPNRAARYLTLAADQAMAENANDLALTCYQRYLALDLKGPEVDRARYRMAVVLTRMSRLNWASQLLENLQAEQSQAPASPEAGGLAVDLHLLLADVRRRQGRRDDALTAAEQAVALCDALDDAARGIEARFLRVQCLRQLGEWQRTAEAIEQLESRVDPQDPRWRGQLASERGRLALAQGQVTEAQGQFEQALRVHFSRSDRTSQVTDICNLSEALLAQGRVPEARVRLSEALTLVESMGNEPLAVTTRMLKGAVRALSGDDTGLDELNRALDTCERRGNRPALLLGHRLRTRVLTHLGRTDEAAWNAKEAAERFGPGALP